MNCSVSRIILRIYKGAWKCWIKLFLIIILHNNKKAFKIRKMNSRQISNTRCCQKIRLQGKGSNFPSEGMGYKNLC